MTIHGLSLAVCIDWDEQQAHLLELAAVLVLLAAVAGLVALLAAAAAVADHREEAAFAFR